MKKKKNMKILFTSFRIITDRWTCLRIYLNFFFFWWKVRKQLWDQILVSENYSNPLFFSRRNLIKRILARKNISLRNTFFFFFFYFKNFQMENLEVEYFEIKCCAENRGKVEFHLRYFKYKDCLHFPTRYDISISLILFFPELWKKIKSFKDFFGVSGRLSMFRGYLSRKFCFLFRKVRRKIK